MKCIFTPHKIFSFDSISAPFNIGIGTIISVNSYSWGHCYWSWAGSLICPVSMRNTIIEEINGLKWTEELTNNESNWSALCRYFLHNDRFINAFTVSGLIIVS